ncbi:ABC transporter substrate-binding protein [Ideonella livida]|uniref:ABC transporter substrate-binding protein n=1 Tax=Ideonella livida TaxID=2707176 RepID=A0A7C9TNV3_9BURK|nr:ABC transporter substrate-binding protein [Ideonella livida]NDY93667.1 ABC transporter substrate-binding protein [Ideonella livida]
MTAFTPRKTLATLAVAVVAAAGGPPAWADITIGVSLPLTGPASSLGIPLQNMVKLWPQQIAGEKLNVIVMDDAGDPSKGVDHVRRFVEHKADLVMGSIVTPVAAAQAQLLFDAQTPQFALAPVMLPPGKETWTFRMSQGTALMASIVVDELIKAKVKTVGFLGYADAYGEGWLTEVNKLLASRPGAPKMVAVERFARTDASVTGQAIKLVSANPEAILVAASGGGAAMPHRGLVERGYKGPIYQTHAAASRDFIRLGGKDVNGAHVLASPSVAAEQIPAHHPSKAHALDFVKQYEGAYGAGTRAIFAASAYDVMVLLGKTVPVALKAGRPGTPEFRTALRDATERLGPTAMSNGVMHFTKDDHWGHTAHSGLVVRVDNGDWKVE